MDNLRAMIAPTWAKAVAHAGLPLDGHHNVGEFPAFVAPEPELPEDRAEMGLPPRALPLTHRARIVQIVQYGARILQLISEGHFRAHAAAICGVNTRTLQSWVDLGTESEGNPRPAEPYLTFARQLTAIEALLEWRVADVVKRAADGGDIKAAVWYLERRFPTRWAANREPELVSDVGPRVQIVEHADVDESSLGKMSADEVVK